MARVKEHIRTAAAFHNVMAAYEVCVESVGNPISSQGSAPSHPCRNAQMGGYSVSSIALDFITDVDNAIAAALADYLTKAEWEDIKAGVANKVAERKIGRLFITRGLYPVKGYFTR